MTRILMVRHCEAQGNTENVFQGHTDCEISGNAKTQLDLLGVRLRNQPIDALYSSPLKRARATAEAINRYHGLPIQIDPRLIEINGGQWEGRHWTDLPRLYPAETEIWYQRPFDFVPEGGETMREVYDRIWGGVTDIVKRNRGKLVCVVSHGCAIRNFLCRALGKPVERLNEVDWCDNTAVSTVDFDDEGNAHVVRMNDASHLTPGTSVFQKQTWWRQEEN